MPYMFGPVRTPRTAAALALTLGLTAGLGLAGCGEDDGGSVRSLGDESSASGASGSGSGSGSGTGEAVCAPVGTDLAPSATETVPIELVDYAFDPPAVEVAAGIVTFDATNAGEEDHELAFLPGGGEVPLTDEGEPDEAALEEAGAFELEAFGPGQSCAATWELEPGTYTMFCVVAAADGELHVTKGMQGTLTVTRPG